ncbi:MAG: hypothetical protein JSV24_06845 [Bacteroidales bacterium]|nr:MAG: hypothetical protein JSV24_06845 [Bacteroidales bacterium]
MNIRFLTSKKFRGLILLFGVAFIVGCGSGGDKEKVPEVSIDMDEINQELFDNISDAKQIFYSLPSPLETAMLVRSAGAEYDEELLNPVDNAGKYTGQRKLALNLGIYTCDLSFASLYDQTQASISYMNAAKRMADGLGILDAIDDRTIERLEENVNNREVLLDIVSETFMNSSSFLEENDRPAIAAIVLVGGWMEGLYIATELVNKGTFEGNKLVERITDQKLSINIVIKLLEENQDNSDVAGILTEVNELKAIFDKITVETSEIEASYDEETNVTTLKSQTSSSMSPEIFAELSEKVKSLRNTYIL